MYPSILKCTTDVDDELDIHIFSKHLQFLDYYNAGAMAAEMGFSGVDLTVRPKGHVLPENVTTDLPKAINDIKAGGSQCQLITTNIKSSQNALDKQIIITAAENGIKYYRTGWFRYVDDISMEESINKYNIELRKLAEYNIDYNIIGCYQNHSGTYIGASYWEIRKLLDKVNSSLFGTQYDIRHAMAEGGRSWTNGFRLLKDHIKVIVLKDFKWAQREGQWKIVNVPIGEGMVDFTSYFRLLKDNDIRVPVSLHLEYPLGGAEKGKSDITVDKEIVYDAMINDLNAIQKLWREA
jgi:sugar phosphate isomerase/epimerase